MNASVYTRHEADRPKRVDRYCRCGNSQRYVGTLEPLLRFSDMNYSLLIPEKFTDRGIRHAPAPSHLLHRVVLFEFDAELLELSLVSPLGFPPAAERAKEPAAEPAEPTLGHS